jgi:hypothetical protein
MINTNGLDKHLTTTHTGITKHKDSMNISFLPKSKQKTELNRRKKKTQTLRFSSNSHPTFSRKQTRNTESHLPSAEDPQGSHCAGPASPRRPVAAVAATKTKPNQTKPRSIPLLRSGAASPGDYRGHADTAEIQQRCAKRVALGIRVELKGKGGGRLGNYIQRRRSHQSHGRAYWWPSDRRILRELAVKEGERRLCKLAKMGVEKRADWV